MYAFTKKKKKEIHIHIYDSKTYRKKKLIFQRRDKKNIEKEKGRKQRGERVCACMYAKRERRKIRTGSDDSP